MYLNTDVSALAALTLVTENCALDRSPPPKLAALAAEANPRHSAAAASLPMTKSRHSTRRGCVPQSLARSACHMICETSIGVTYRPRSYFIPRLRFWPQWPTDSREATHVASRPGGTDASRVESNRGGPKLLVVESDRLDPRSRWAAGTDPVADLPRKGGGHSLSSSR